MEDFILLGFILSFTFYLKKTKNNIIFPDIILILFYITIIPTIIGIIVITRGNAEDFMSFGLGNFISEETVQVVYFDYFISWIITFLIFGVLYKKVKLVPSIIDDNQYKNIIIILGLIPLVVDFLLMPEYPLIKLIQEGIDSGAVSRGYVINYQIKNGIPLINLIIRGAPTITLIWLFKNWLVGKKDLYFPLYFVFYIIVYSMTLAKSFIIVPFALIYWQYSLIRSGNIKNITLTLASTLSLIFVFLIISFYLISDNISEALNSLFMRSFVIQSEGAFLIREEYPNFDINALLYGFPFSKYLDIFVESYDPSVEVVKRYFPGIDGWVNINSYYIGQGAVMLGKWVSFIGPIILFFNILNISIIYKYFNKLSGKKYIYFIIAGYYIITIPLNTNFSLILYLKPVFSTLILSLYYFIGFKFISKNG